jgi:hypothetical protein
MIVVEGTEGTSDVVVLDASVLFPAALRDTLVRTAQRGLYTPRWTNEIVEEVRRNLVKDLGLREDQARKPLEAMQKALPEAKIGGYQDLLPAMTNEMKDRHVLAAAVAGGAGTIVTANLRHFPDVALAPYDLQAISPDDFLSDLLEQEPDVILDVLRTQAQALKNPPKSVAEVVASLSRSVPSFAASVTTRMALSIL